MKPSPTPAKRQRAAVAPLPAPADAGQRAPIMGTLTVTAVPKVDRARAVAAAQRIRELSERRKPSRTHGATKAIRELRDDGK